MRDHPKAFAQACLELLRNDDLCKRLGDAAREAAIRPWRSHQHCATN